MILELLRSQNTNIRASKKVIVDTGYQGLQKIQ